MIILKSTKEELQRYVLLLANTLSLQVTFFVAYETTGLKFSLKLFTKALN